MNEELQKALGELLSKANNGIDAASGFLVVELPEVIQQLLVWHSLKSCIYGVLFTFVLATSVYGLYRAIKACAVNADYFPGVLAGLVSSSVCALITFKFFSVALMIWVAPKVWLLEYAAQLTK